MAKRRVYKIETETGTIVFGATGKREYTHAVITLVTQKYRYDENHNTVWYDVKPEWKLASKNTSLKLAESKKQILEGWKGHFSEIKIVEIKPE